MYRRHTKGLNGDEDDAGTNENKLTNNKLNVSPAMAGFFSNVGQNKTIPEQNTTDYNLAHGA